ncbi:MAG: MFS transporter [Chloroflexota bacterium]|nr:MFS transporter [Chloroflexota bacterium]
MSSSLSTEPTPVSEVRPATGMLHSVHVYPAFRLLMIGTLATNTAFWMYQVAVGWLALELTDSPFFVGLSGFAGGIPMLIPSLPAGVLIDRFDGRSVLLAAQTGVMLVAALFAVTVVTDIVQPWLLLILAALYGSAMSFVFPSRTTIVPSLVERKDLSNGIALNAATQNATRVIGPSVAGVLIATVGIGGTFAFAAALQIFALYTTFKLPSQRLESAHRPRMGLRESLTVGLRIVANSPFLLGLILLALAPTVLVMPYINLMPVFARDEMGMGSGGLGLLLAATGVGTVIGALSVARSVMLQESKWSQIVTVVLFTIFVMAFAVVAWFPLAMALLFLAGMMSAAYLALNQTALQLHVDDDVRGRVLSVYLLTWGMLPLGQLFVGFLANLLGTPIAVVVACALSLGLVIWIWLRFREGREPAHASVAAD